MRELPDRLVSICGSPLSGIATLPGDKSLSHRAALLAALAESQSLIRNFLVAGVTRAMLGALTALGVAWELQGASLAVAGRGFAGLRAPVEAIDCGNSATTMRLLAGALGAAGVSAVLDGSAGLRARPMARIDPWRHCASALFLPPACPCALGYRAPLGGPQRPGEVLPAARRAGSGW